MPKGEAVFYVGRVVKTGFDADDLKKALLEPKAYIENDIAWSIIGTEIVNNEGSTYVKGELCKAKPDAKVTVLNSQLSEKEEKEEPRLVFGLSEFIYIPEYSGITFRSIPNQIEPRAFIRIFNRIIEDTLGTLLVQSEIKMLDDLKGFYEQLIKIDTITCIKTRVKPPNPLFGRLWESLKKYLESRTTEELQLKEVGKKKGIVTKVKELIKLILEGDEEKISQYITTNNMSIVDLSVLMSLDGYGDGRIDGTQGSKHVFIKTHERIIHFTLPTEHSVDDVYYEANSIYLEINNERYLKH